MYGGNNLDNAFHRWLKANYAQNCMRRHENHVSNAGWYWGERSSLGRRQTEIRCTKRVEQNGHGTRWQAE